LRLPFVLDRSPGHMPPSGLVSEILPKISTYWIDLELPSVFLWGVSFLIRFSMTYTDPGKSLEIDYVAAAHAVWLSGRTAVFLSSKWSPTVLEIILKRTDVQIVLYGATTPCAEIPVPSFCTFDFVSDCPPPFCPPPQWFEAVQKIPIICSVTPTSGSTGVPKSIAYPMRKSLAVLDEESSTLLEPKDGQWLRGGTVSVRCPIRIPWSLNVSRLQTFLRPLFEIRRFMFNQTTLYLDHSLSVADQCASFCAELSNSSNPQPLRVHFTPSVFRAFVDYVKMKYGPDHSFSRLYWMVIGGESISVTDLQLAKQVFPRATVACNYAVRQCFSLLALLLNFSITCQCSEVGFAGVCQMFVRPYDVVPDVINFNATQGCEDLVLLDDDINVIPKHEGTSGIVGIITTACATHYLGNEEATRRMFRPWGDDRILLYTDDIGNMGADGCITINGRRSRNVKINGLLIDMDDLESALSGSFPDGSVQAYKLVKSAEKIVLFWSGRSTDMEVLKWAHEALRKDLVSNLAMVVASTRYIEEMPYNASYKIDLAKLQSIADEDQHPTGPHIVSPDSVVKHTEAVCSRIDEIAGEVAAKVAKLSKSSKHVAVDVPLTLLGLNSITVVQLYFWLQERYDYDDDMSRLFGEDVTALVLAHDIAREPGLINVTPQEVASYLHVPVFESQASVSSVSATSSPEQTRRLCPRVTKKPKALVRCLTCLNCFLDQSSNHPS
jgi:acyl-CoA synthetase (AMP-forming)/AMP-acid ligase II